ncbi:hypothetical protein C8R47DRAFT_1071859 [Mycena vitilis]|nr:hypothetical protein C8R47DRAFT_1071859 [Mycena vitilis]
MSTQFPPVSPLADFFSSVVAKVTRSKAPGARPFVPPPDILNLPAAATEEHLGGPGSLAHLKASAKIQDKEEEEPEVEIVGESMAEAGGEEFNTPRIRAKNEKRPTQALFSELLALLPAKERQDLPRSDDGKYYKISYDLIREVMRVTDPMMSGNVCRVRGYPAMCDTCLRGHGSKICNLAQPDEINNDVWGSLMAYTDLSCESWKQTRETLGQSFKALESLESTRNNLLGEYQFNLLKYLVSILRARRELTTGEFWERFDNETSGETLLRLAMAQQLTAETEVTRAYVWQYCEFEYLHLDLPLFKSAYDFYRTVDEARGEARPARLLLGACASEFDTVAKDEGKVPAGIRSGDIRRRLRFEKAFEDGKGKARSIPRDTHGTAFPHGTGLRPTGFLEKLWTAYGPALFDIEAEESSGESSSEEDSDLSDNARAEMEFIADGRATRKQARRDRQPDHPRRPRPDTAVSSPATPRASGSNVVLPGEIKRPVVRRSPGKPRVAPKSDAMVVDSDAGGSGLNRRPSLCPPIPCHMQSPGDLRIDETVFPPASQALVRHLHTVSVIGVRMPSSPALLSAGEPEGHKNCLFLSRQWWYQEFPPGGAEVFSYNEPAAFAELWHYLSFRELQPWYFEGCLEDGYPVSLIFSNKDYIDSITSAEFLRQLISVYQAEDRQLLVAFASRRLRRMPDFVPTPLESQASGTVVRRSAHSV